MNNAKARARIEATRSQLRTFHPDVIPRMPRDLGVLDYLLNNLSKETLELRAWGGWITPYMGLESALRVVDLTNQQKAAKARSKRRWYKPKKTGPSLPAYKLDFGDEIDVCLNEHDEFFELAQQRGEEDELFMDFRQVDTTAPEFEPVTY